MQALIVAGRYIKVGRSYVIQGGGGSGSLPVHIVVMELLFSEAWRMWYPFF